MQLRALSLLMTVLCTLTWLSGCCCCYSGGGGGTWTPEFNVEDGISSDGSSDDSSTSAADPNASKEMQDAHNYAQKALNAKGYGAVKTANLQKDGLNWYVTGTAGGLDGGEVSYEVWFYVTRYEGDDSVRQNWSVKTVTVNGEVVYP